MRLCYRSRLKLQWNIFKTINFSIQCERFGAKKGRLKSTERYLSQRNILFAISEAHKSSSFNVFNAFECLAKTFNALLCIV